MHAVKRIEIIANSFELSKLLEALALSGIKDYAEIRNVGGKQQHAGKEDLDMTMGDNVYILAYCEPDALNETIEKIRPLLNKFGGSCHISDALEVRSMNCSEQL